MKEGIGEFKLNTHFFLFLYFFSGKQKNACVSDAESGDRMQVVGGGGVGKRRYCVKGKS